MEIDVFWMRFGIWSNFFWEKIFQEYRSEFRSVFQNFKPPKPLQKGLRIQWKAHEGIAWFFPYRTMPGWFGVVVWSFERMRLKKWPKSRFWDFDFWGQNHKFEWKLVFFEWDLRFDQTFFGKKFFRNTDLNSDRYSKTSSHQNRFEKEWESNESHMRG